MPSRVPSLQEVRRRRAEYHRQRIEQEQARLWADLRLALVDEAMDRLAQAAWDGEDIAPIIADLQTHIRGYARAIQRCAALGAGKRRERQVRAGG